MVEATTSADNTAVAAGAAALGLGQIDRESALGLFREAELNTHIDIVLANYIAEAVKVS